MAETYKYQFAETPEEKAIVQEKANEVVARAKKMKIKPGVIKPDTLLTNIRQVDIWAVTDFFMTVVRPDFRGSILAYGNALLGITVSHLFNNTVLVNDKIEKEALEDSSVRKNWMDMMKLGENDWIQLARSEQDEEGNLKDEGAMTGKLYDFAIIEVPSLGLPDDLDEACVMLQETIQYCMSRVRGDILVYGAVGEVEMKAINTLWGEGKIIQPFLFQYDGPGLALITEAAPLKEGGAMPSDRYEGVEPAVTSGYAQVMESKEEVTDDLGDELEAEIAKEDKPLD